MAAVTGVKRSANGNPKYPRNKTEVITIDDDDSDDERMPTLADFLPKKEANRITSSDKTQSRPLSRLDDPSGSSPLSRKSSHAQTASPAGRTTAISISGSESSTPTFISARSSPTSISDGPTKPVSSKLEKSGNSLKTQAINTKPEFIEPPRVYVAKSNSTISKPAYPRSRSQSRSPEVDTSTLLSSFINPLKKPPRKGIAHFFKALQLPSKRESEFNSVTPIKVPEEKAPSRPKSPVYVSDDPVKSEPVRNRPRRPNELLNEGLTAQRPFSHPVNNTLASPNVAARTVNVVVGSPRKDWAPPPTISIPVRSLQPFQSSQPSQKVSIVVEDAKRFAGPLLDKSHAYINSREPKHGMSEMYSTADDNIRMQRLAQPKAKRVNRADIKLDWGLPPQPAAHAGETARDPRREVRRIQKNQLRDVQGPPIKVINTVNGKQLPSWFQFIPKNIIHKGLKVASRQSLQGCSCIGGCNQKTCECLLETDEFEASGRMNLADRRIPYMQTPNGVVLSPSYIDLEIGYQIQECNEDCGCENNCWNRVVQKGRTLPLEIFMTAKCGFGLRSPWPIARGQFIDCYVGELVTTKEINRRERLRRKAFGPNAPSYTFSLDYFKDAELKGKGPMYQIDGERFSGPTRFINHSCDPNCRIFTVMDNKLDYRVYSLAFFAIRDIMALEELTFDYNPDEAGIPEDQEVPSGAIKCHCGARNCKRILWGGAKGN